MRISLLLLALGLGACERPPAPPSHALPVFAGAAEYIDEGAETPSFVAFRDSLRAIVARQDTTAFLGLVAEDAQVSYDNAPGGPDGLRNLWFAPEATPPEALWAVFDRILSAGSVEEDGAFTVPYVAGLWPEDLDPYQHVSAIGDSTTAFDRPGGQEVAHLSGVLILPLSDSTDATAWHVVLPDGSDAYIPRTGAVSPVGYRATFWQTSDDQWKLQVLLTGD